MKVLMTTDAVGGVWTHAVALCESLDGHGVDVHLAVLGPGPTRRQIARAHDLPNVTLHGRRGRLEWMPGCERDLEDHGEWLLDLENALDPDLVHLNDYVHAQLPFRAPVLVGAHSCVAGWWEAVRGHAARPVALPGYVRRVRAGLRAADAVVAPSAAMLRSLGRHYGALPASSHVIHNGLPPPGPNGERKEDLFLSVGRLWDPAKNVRTLDRAAEALPWPVLAAGKTRNEKGRALPLRNAQALGRIRQDALEELYGHAAVFVSGALYEPFGLAALEAARHGSALVLPDIPSQREIWGDAALYADPRDPDQMTRALRRVSERRRNRRTLGERASQRARWYTGQRMGDEYYRLYRELARTGRGSRPGGMP